MGAADPVTPTKPRAGNARRSKQQLQQLRRSPPSSLKFNCWLPGTWPDSPVVQPDTVAALTTNTALTVEAAFIANATPTHNVTPISDVDVDMTPPSSPQDASFTSVDGSPIGLEEDCAMKDAIVDCAMEDAADWSEFEPSLTSTPRHVFESSDSPVKALPVEPVTPVTPVRRRVEPSFPTAPPSPIKMTPALPNSQGMSFNITQMWPTGGYYVPPDFDNTPPNIFAPKPSDDDSTSRRASSPTTKAPDCNHVSPSPARKNDTPVSTPTKASTNSPAMIGSKTSISGSPSPCNKLLELHRLSPTFSARGYHTRPSSPPPHRGPLRTNVLKSALHLERARAIATAARVAHAKYKAAHDARNNGNAEARAKDNLDVEETGDNTQVSIHTTSSYDNDLSTLPDAPTPPAKKSVTFTVNQHVRTFYQDALVSEYQDSTLLSIISCTDPAAARAALRMSQSSEEGLLAEEGRLAEEGHFFEESKSPEKCPDSPTRKAPPKSDIPEVSLVEDLTAALHIDSDDGGFRGVPQDIFDYSDDEDSLEESQLSIELVDELYEDVEQQLKIAPPQNIPLVPAPTTKPLVSPLTDAEKDILNAAIKATDNGRNHIQLVPGKLSTHDFSTLLPREFNGDPRAWLNDNIVNEYLNTLVDDIKKKEGYEHQKDGPAPSVHAFASQWYNNMCNNPTSVARWAFRKNLAGTLLLDARLMLFPICLGGNHWVLLAIKGRERFIEVYDSLGRKSEGGIVKVARDWLKMELGDLYVAAEWKDDQQRERSQKQQNSSDCGVFTLLNALCLLRGEEHSRVVPVEFMDDARRRLAVSLLAGQPTTELD